MFSKILSLFFHFRLTHVKTVNKSVTLSSKKKITHIYWFQFANYDVQPTEVLRWEPVPSTKYKLDDDCFGIQINDFIEEEKVYCFRLVCDIDHKNKSEELICSSISGMFLYLSKWLATE